MSKDIKPETKEDEYKSSTSHPSFGCVTFNRIQSTGTHLFGSSVAHSGYVTLTVHEAGAIVDKFTKEMITYARKQILQISLSEAQYAELVSRWGTAQGTPCTLSRRPAEGFELVGFEAPRPDKTTKETFEGLIADAVKTTQTKINETADEIQALVKDRLPKKDAERLRILISILKTHPASNLKFAQELLHESLEKMLARGKVEMEAAGRSLLERLGLSKVAEATKLLPKFEGLDDE